jgi:hypothetical protein
MKGGEPMRRVYQSAVLRILLLLTTVAALGLAAGAGVWFDP